jgi:hypothetical protein
VVRAWWAQNPGEWERSRVPGKWSSRSRGGKPGQQSGGLGLLSARNNVSPQKTQIYSAVREGGFQGADGQMGSFHTLLRQKPSFLYILVRLSSISVASLMMRSMCLGLVCGVAECGAPSSFCAPSQLSGPDIRTSQSWRDTASTLGTAV